MKQLIKPIPRQAVFFPACADASAGRLLPHLRSLRNFAGLALSFFLITACPDPPKDNTPERDTSINLEVLSTFTTTAKLHISVEDTTAEWTFGLTRNGEDVLTATVFNSDTTFTDGGLTPGTQYTYQAQWLNDGIAVDSSLNAIALTMDTTSHNFVWEFDTLGIWGSALYDVAVIDENNIWAVGEIKTDEPDTAHNLPYTKYNAAHWDGNEWELINIISNVEKKAIFAFAEDDIWIASTLPMHYDGTDWYMYTPQDNNYPSGLGWINAIWGTSSSNIYFVGSSGGIVHYDGINFTVMESGTDINLLDITGSANGEEIFVSGWDNYDGRHGSILIGLEGGEWNIILESDSYLGNPNEGDYGHLEAIDIFGDTLFVSAAEGFIKMDISTGNIVFISSIEAKTQGFTIKGITAQNSNDIMLFGGGGQIVHFNGVFWNLDEQIATNQMGEYYNKGTLKDNIVCMAGQISWIAKIAIGKRNE